MLRDLTIVAIIAGVAGIACGWSVQGWRKDKEIAVMQAAYNQHRADAEENARIKEQGWQSTAEQITRDKNAQIATTTRRLNNTIAGLRTRSERPTGEMPTTPGACFGLSGAQLARGDGEFLAGYAADAARLEAALEQCEAQYNLLRS